MISRQWLLIASAVVQCMLMACGVNTLPTLAGSETTSGVEIEAVGTTIKGKTTPDATVMIFDARYFTGDTLKVFADTLTADDSGTVVFTDLLPGKYNVFVYPGSPAQGAAVLGIPVSQNWYFRYGDTAQFASLRTITGIVTQNGKPDSLSQLFIAGSSFYTKPDASGNFSFREVPVGSYSIVARFLNKKGFSTDSVSVDLSLTKDTIVSVSVNLP
jgi:hypothetical protein